MARRGDRLHDPGAGLPGEPARSTALLILVVLALVALGLALARNGAFGPVVAAAVRGGLRWGAIVGLVGFVLGYVGPIVLTPESNQGPLLGIFITGPGGALLGFVYGAVASVVRGDRSDA